MITSLFQINTRLYALMQARREVLEESAFLPSQENERQASLAEIDAAIRSYVVEEIRNNPNSVHQYLLECRARQADIKAEIKRLDGLLAGEEGDEARAKALVLDVMREIGEKSLPVRGKLARQGNGGVRPVEVVQPELVPDKFKKITVTMPYDEWLFARTHALASVEIKETLAEPDLNAIRESLLKREPCPNCRGHKTISDVKSDRCGIVIHIQTPCDECGATGEIAGGVPGCRLLDRGEHLRVS